MGVSKNNTEIGLVDVHNPGNTASIQDDGALVVNLHRSSRSAFGEVLVGQLFNRVSVAFNYGINAQQVTTRTIAGTVTNGDSMAHVSTGAGANQSAELQTIEALEYRTGIGGCARFTALFTAGASGSTQVAGVGTANDGFFFGYNGAAFGILHRRNGSSEFRTLTITTKSSTAENAVVTLNGVAHNIAVTNGADTTVTANEIAAGTYSGWTASAKGNTVIFRNWDSGAKSGAYSITGTTVVGSIAQTLAGATPTETWIPQASWNGEDTFDGTGHSGVTIDPTKGNVYQIRYQWLGFGAITFFVEDPDDGEFHTMHTIEYSNANTTPSLAAPTLPMFFKASNTSNATDIIVKTSSMALFNEGQPQLTGPRRALGAGKTGISTTELPVLSLRNDLVFGGRANRSIPKFMRMLASSEHTKPMYIRVYSNPVLVGSSWTSVDTNTSPVSYDTAATSFTGGTLLLEVPLGKSAQFELDLSSDLFAGRLPPGTVLTLVAAATSGSGAEVRVGVTWAEGF